MEIRYSVAILCGGQSRRMGTDKAMLDWQGIPMLQHIADGFPDCDDLFLSVRDAAQYADFPYPKVCDQVAGCGPLAGLCASLEAAKHSILFVTTCDAPLVDKTTADILVNALADYDAVVPMTSPATSTTAALASLSAPAAVNTSTAPNAVTLPAAAVTLAAQDTKTAPAALENPGKRHPLIAAYRKDILPTALSHLAARDLRLRSLLEALQVNYFSAENLPHGELTLSNLNTPAEMEQLLLTSIQ